MTQQRFKDYSYDAWDAINHTQDDIDSHISNGWTIKDFKTYTTKGGYIHLMVLYEKESQPQIK